MGLTQSIIFFFTKFALYIIREYIIFLWKVSIHLFIEKEKKQLEINKEKYFNSKPMTDREATENHQRGEETSNPIKETCKIGKDCKLVCKVLE